jgi:hypothetical protein
VSDTKAAPSIIHNVSILVVSSSAKHTAAVSHVTGPVSPFAGPQIVTGGASAPPALKSPSDAANNDGRGSGPCGGWPCPNALE